MGLSVHVVKRLPERAMAVNMSDIEYTLNGVGITLDILGKKSPLLTAQSLHLLRALVTPPQFLLLPPYHPPHEVERIMTQSISHTHAQSLASATPFSAQRSAHHHQQQQRFFESHQVHTDHGDVPDTPQRPLDSSSLLARGDDRCPSPSSTVMSHGCTPTSLLLERSQKHTRSVARRCNAIQKLVAVLENSFNTTLYIHNIRLGLAQVSDCVPCSNCFD
jgi:hypothetical protein